jgi:carboxypeptidase PM20D1
VKRLARFAALALLVLVLVLVVNMLRVPSLPSVSPAPSEARPPSSQAGAAMDPARIAEHLAGAIRIETVSHQLAEEDDPAKFRALRAYLETTYPKAHATLHPEGTNDREFLCVWTGRNPAAKPALFLAHQDVVPVEPGTETKWTKPPFSGAVDGEFVWGRGALDDKGAMIALFEAVESLIEEGFQPARSIYFAFGADEEVGGSGAARLAALLASRGLRFAFVLDEGSVVIRGVLSGVEAPIAAIGVAEKGLASFELVAEAQAGHSSIPPQVTAIGALAGAIDRIASHPMESRLRGAPRTMMLDVARVMPLDRRLVLANLWLFEPMLLDALSKKPTTNALTRTTIVPTIFNAGVKENVLPAVARAVVNARILQGDTVETVLEHLRRVIADDRIRVSKMTRIVAEPSAESSTGSDAWRLIAGSIRAEYPAAMIVPTLVTGITDARHYASIADDVYRFVPFELEEADVKRVHGIDERVSLKSLAAAVRVYRAIMRGE